MKIPGYLDPSYSPPAPFIYAQLESGALEGRQSLSLLIDTGSSVTTIMDLDRERLGIDWDRLARTDRKLTGIGGTVDTRTANDAVLFLKSQSGAIVRERVDLYVAKHDIIGLDRRAEERVLELPSLLGRDVIESYRLVYDRSKTQVYLEK